MTDKIDDGGLYHPLPDTNGYHSQLGITRRDWLAGLAMQSILGKPSKVLRDEINDGWGRGCSTAGELIAKWSYQYADAMISEGRKGVE